MTIRRSLSKFTACLTNPSPTRKPFSMSYVYTSELELFRFFDMTPDLVIIAGKDGYFKMFNNAVVQKLGYPPDVLLSTPIHHFIHPDDKELTAERRAELFTGKELVNFENRYITSEGKAIWLNWTSIFVPDKEVAFAIAKDITEKKEVELNTEEKFQQFRNLVHHFKASIEKDKKYLAAELHEQLAQLASTVKIDINWITDNLRHSDPRFSKRLEHAQSINQMLIDGIRKMSYEISPGMIDDMGLNETLRWFCAEFAKLNNIECFVETGIDDSIISSDLQLDLYRITQDLLKDLADSSAVRIVVTVESSDEGELFLRVSHNGERNNSPYSDNTGRLNIIRERVSSINGQIIIHEEGGAGNVVSIRIPSPVNA